VKLIRSRFSLYSPPPLSLSLSQKDGSLIEGRRSTNVIFTLEEQHPFSRFPVFSDPKKVSSPQGEEFSLASPLARSKISLRSLGDFPGRGPRRGGPVDAKNRLAGETRKKGQTFSYDGVPRLPPSKAAAVTDEETRYQLVAVGISSAARGSGGSVLFYYLDAARDTAAILFLLRVLLRSGISRALFPAQGVHTRDDASSEIRERDFRPSRAFVSRARLKKPVSFR